MAFGTSIKLSNIRENWLFQFGFSNGDAEAKGEGGFDIIRASNGNNNLLKGAISSSSARSIDVDDSSVFSVGDFIKINDGSNPEIIKITGITDSDTITATRGQLGTSATTHSDDAKLYWNNFLGFAFTDTTYEGTYYRGVITNKPSIRESLDVLKGTTKTSNVNITIPDFDYSGAKISKELFGGTHVYVNQEVKVFCQVNDDTPTQIGSFRLVDISSNGDSINLSLQNKTPWDYITIPNEESYSGVKVPVVYGDYTANATNTFMTGKTLYPAPKTKLVGDDVYYIATKQITGTNGLPHYYDSNLDMFIRLNDAGATETRDGVGDRALGVKNIFDRGTYLFRPGGVSDFSPTSSGTNTGSPSSRDFSYTVSSDNFANAIDGNVSTYTRIEQHITSQETMGAGSALNTFDALHGEFGFKMPPIQGILTEFKVFIKATLSMTAGTNRDQTSGGNTQGNRLTVYETTFGSEDNKILEIHESSPITPTLTDTTSGGTGYSDYEEIDLLSRYRDIEDSGRELASAVSDVNQPVITLDDTYNVAKGTLILIDSEIMRIEWSTLGIVSVTRGYNSTTKATHSSGATVYVVGSDGYVTPSKVSFRTVADLTNDDHTVTTQTVSGALDVFDIFVKISVASDYTREPTASETLVKDTNRIYLGNNGLKNSWADNAITLITDAHLDMLIRYAGLTKADGEAISSASSDVEGYSTLKDARDNDDTWGVRYWCLETTELKKVLEQMAFEGGFWFRYKNNGSPQYGFLADSPSTNYTLSAYDIDNVSMKLTPLSSVVTKRRIGYHRHPATGNHLGNDSDTPVIVAEDTTNNYRKTFNIKTAENIEEVNLDMLISNIGDTNIGNDNPNDTFASYYGDINGRVKLLVSCTIVNPKFYDLEVGNVVVFDNNNMYPEVPFGVNSASWNNLKFVVTSVNRSLGELKIQVREI